MNPNTNLTVTGVDLGSSSVKIAAVLKGGVQIITNEANFRQTPNVIGFGEKQRLIGQTGQVKIKSNHSNTVIAPSRFLGFDRNCSYLNEQLKFCPAKSQKIQNENSKLSFSLLYGEERQYFTVQQLVAGYLTEIEKIIAQTNNLSNKNLVIAVPPYFTQHERKALMNAVQICKKKINNEYSVQLVNQQVAISMDYGYSKKIQYSQDLDKAKKVLFIDFGHSKVNLFVTAFNKQHLRVLSNKFERQLGCKFMDSELLKFYANLFDSAHPNMQLNILQSKKAVLKLLENIEKQRKVLSGNIQHDFSIQCLLEDQDLYYSMKREQYEKICQPIVQNFKKMLESFVIELKQKGIQFDTIELIGGGTRIPMIINAVTEVFGQEPSRTINSNQCVARGAALISAMNSSIFRVQPYSAFTISPYTIELKLNGQKLQTNLIEKNQLLLRQKSIEIEVNSQLKKFNLVAQYQYENTIEGLETKIFNVQFQIQHKNIQTSQKTTQMKQESEQINKNKLKISIIFDQTGIIGLENITSLNKQVTIKILKPNYFEKFTSLQLDQMEQKQKQMALKDSKIKKFYEKKNQYESLIYKTKSTIQDIVSKNLEYTSKAQIDQIKQFIESEQNWLNSAETNNELKLEEFSKKEKLLKQKTDQFSMCVNQIKQSHALVNNQIQKLAVFLNEIIQKRNSNMYPEEVNKVGEWVNQIIQKQKSSPKNILPIVTVDQIKQIHQDLIKKINDFDQQIQRQNQANLGRNKPNQPRNPHGGYYKPTQTPYSSYGSNTGRSNDENYFRPRTTRHNRGGYQNQSNPFGSLFGNGFSGFF